MVSGARWAEVDEIFTAALDLPSRERAAWLQRVCSGNPDLRAEVERLLALAEEDDDKIPLGKKERILDVVHAFLGERARRRLTRLLSLDPPPS